MRLALAEQALRIAPTGRLEFLFLDEVLSSLDDDRRQAVRQVLDIVQSHGVFKHVVMVTHLESVKQVWAGARLDVRKVDAKTSRVVAGELDETSYLQADGEVLDLEEVNA